MRTKLSKLLRRVKRAASILFRGNLKATERHTFFKPGGRPSKLTKEVLEPLDSIRGFFNIDDRVHFFIMLQMQTRMGVWGDILEIGSYHGQSAALLAQMLSPNEQLIVCDAFEADTADRYSNKISPADLLDNIRKAASIADLDRVRIEACYSTDLQLPIETRLRFAHIDGDHSESVAFHDLELCAPFIVENGIIAVDDFQHPDWPGVTLAVERFLHKNQEFSVFADLNRREAKGRKLYLIRHATGDFTESTSQNPTD